jgi:hypothetical protein
MKWFTLFCFSIAAAAYAPAYGLSLEAHEVGTGAAQTSNWETNYGSYDRDFSRSKKILVTVRNISRKPTPFAVMVYFVAKPAIAPGEQGYDARRLFIYDRGEHAGEFRNEIELSGEFSSRTIIANVQHYQALGVESAAGADTVGWIVVGFSDGQVFGIAASSQELLQIARGQSTQSFEKMIAEYEQEHPSTLTSKHHPAAKAPKAPGQEPQVAANAHTPARVPLPSPAEEIVTLTRPVEVKISYGSTRLPTGTKLKVVSRSDSMINAAYFNDTVAIPLDAVASK